MIVSTVNSEICASFFFRENLHMRSFLKIKSSRNGLITRLFTDEGKLCYSHNFLHRANICLIRLFAKIKFSQKFLSLQHSLSLLPYSDAG